MDCVEEIGERCLPHSPPSPSPLRRKNRTTHTTHTRNHRETSNVRTHDEARRRQDLARAVCAHAQAGQQWQRPLVVRSRCDSQPPAAWKTACDLQADMFRQAGDGLSVSLIYFRGSDECKATGWVTLFRALRSAGRSRCSQARREGVRPGGQLREDPPSKVEPSLPRTLTSLARAARSADGLPFHTSSSSDEKRPRGSAQSGAHKRFPSQHEDLLRPGSRRRLRRADDSEVKPRNCGEGDAEMWALERNGPEIPRTWEGQLTGCCTSIGPQA